MKVKSLLRSLSFSETEVTSCADKSNQAPSATASSTSPSKDVKKPFPGYVSARSKIGNLYSSKAWRCFHQHLAHTCTEEPRSKASVNSVIRSIRHVFISPNFFLFFSLLKHSANKAFGNKANRAIRHDFFNPMVMFYSAIAHFHFPW